jgi:hypothetical protein
MKHPWDWTEDDLVRLVTDQVEESLSIEYKASDALQLTDGKKTEVSKDVSALANSAGGVIVYGMSEKDNLPVGLDAGYEPKPITREWLEQVINSKIQPRIDGIRINPVPLTTTSPGNVAFVVSIPQSLRAPHMAADHRYYKRYNFQAIMMEDYEVRDVARRLLGADLKVSLSYTAGERIRAVDFDTQDRYAIQQARLALTITNSSSVMATHAHFRIWIDRRLDPLTANSPALPILRSIGERTGRREQTRYALLGLCRDYAVPPEMPIWEGLSVFAGAVDIQVRNDTITQYPIVWECFTPHSEITRGAYLLDPANDGRRADMLVFPSVIVTNDGFDLRAESG